MGDEADSGDEKYRWGGGVLYIQENDLAHVSYTDF